MERLYLPPSLRYFEPLRVIPREPTAHSCFLYDLVEALRPRLVVDVGTGSGAALSVLCQSMRDHDVDGTAYGIDTWYDDDGKDEHDPTRWNALNNFLRTYLRGVFYLLKMPCEAGLQHFATGSIDLLRLNAPRAGAGVEQLVAAWRERLAPGGVMLCPGVNDDARPELREQWAKVAAGGGSFAFSHGKGLGVLRRPASGKENAPELLALLDSPDPDLGPIYEHADRYYALRAEINAKWGDLARKK